MEATYVLLYYHRQLLLIRLRALVGKKKTKVFGVSLKDRMEYEEANLNNYQQVPQIVSNLINLIGEMEPVEGVFRVNGSGKNIHELASALDQRNIIICSFFFLLVNILLSLQRRRLTWQSSQYLTWHHC